MSALPPITDMEADIDFGRDVPQADIDLGYSITSSARRKNEDGILIFSALAVC